MSLYNATRSMVLRPNASSQLSRAIIKGQPRQWFGNRADKANEHLKQSKVMLRKLGDFPYGSREYQLVARRPKNPTDPSDDETAIGNNNNDDDDAEKESFQPLASLRAHRNIVFGARLLGGVDPNSPARSLSDVCSPLLEAALVDCAKDGEQPQALATLHGLCDYVTAGLQPDAVPSQALQTLETDDRGSYEAVRAIATGIPREGHSIVGQATFRDGEVGWEALAREFIDQKLAPEVELYRSSGGTVVAIEHLADTNPAYLKSAGGAMARLFFV